MIIYDKYNKTVRQSIDSYSLYDMEGDLGELAAKMANRHQELLQEYKEPKAIREGYCNRGDYLDGTLSKKVSFSKFVVEKTTEDDYERLTIFGVRDMLPEELEALAIENKKNNDAQEARDKAEFERIKKQRGWQ